MTNTGFISMSRINLYLLRKMINDFMKTNLHLRKTSSCQIASSTVSFKNSIPAHEKFFLFKVITTRTFCVSRSQIHANFRSCKFYLCPSSKYSSASTVYPLPSHSRERLISGLESVSFSAFDAKIGIFHSCLNSFTAIIWS